MQMARPNPREALLEAAVAYVSDHGVSDLSLRKLASAIGTSHRMLIYHFGSKDELLVAIVEQNERAQQVSFLEALPSGDTSPSEALRRTWHRLADPSMWPSERLFFELYGQALQQRQGTSALLDPIVSSWTVPAVSPEHAEAHARLNLAVVRGLLLDLLATGDVEGTNRAMDLFIELLAS